jgi:HK97 family phage prohead protease
MTTRAIADRAKTSGIERRSYPVSLQVTRAAGGNGPTRIEGYASVTEAGYDMWDWAGEYTEVVRQGAFAKTLGENPAVQLLLNHGGLSMAYTKAGTLQLSEDTTGLHMGADLNPTRTDVRDMLTALEDGAVDEMSFAFRVTRQQWSPDYSQRDILEVDIHKGDVSVVNFGANPGTSVEAMRSLDIDRMTPAAAAELSARLASRAAATSSHDQARAKLGDLAERAKAGTLTPADTTQLVSLLAQLAAADAGFDPFVDALCAVDEALDSAQMTVAGLLGVPSPDAPDDGMSSGTARARLDLLRLR